MIGDLAAQEMLADQSVLLGIVLVQRIVFFHTIKTISNIKQQHPWWSRFCRCSSPLWRKSIINIRRDK